MGWTADGGTGGAMSMDGPLPERRYRNKTCCPLLSVGTPGQGSGEHPTERQPSGSRLPAASLPPVAGCGARGRCCLKKPPSAPQNRKSEN